MGGAEKGGSFNRRELKERREDETRNAFLLQSARIARFREDHPEGHPEIRAARQRRPTTYWLRLRRVVIFGLAAVKLKK